MTRLAVAVIAVALLLPLGGTPGGGVAPAAGAECTWHRHSKRIVKRVRRQGKVRRVVRRRHWWTCDPVAAAPLSSPPPLPYDETPPLEEPAANRLGVKSAEYLFVLSRPSVAAGAVTVELSNYGEDPHNLHLQRQGGADPDLEIAETGPQQRTVGQFELPAGTYRLWCSLPEHDELGMHATLEVEGG